MVIPSFSLFDSFLFLFKLPLFLCFGVRNQKGGTKWRKKQKKKERVPPLPIESLFLFSVAPAFELFGSPFVVYEITETFVSPKKKS